MHSHALGQLTEQQACRLLQQGGLRLLARNYRCRLGELDLVMRDTDTVVFVEVRYRRSSRWGSAEESVDWRKRQRVVNAARHYLLTHPHLADQPCRFDVVAAAGNPEDPHSYRWIRDAFTSQ